MENNEFNLQEQQVSKSALKIKELIACFIYAVVYTFCLYKNSRGITFPFFAGVTLYFLNYTLKKYGATCGKFARFLMASIMIISVLVCTTNSYPIIILSKVMLSILFAIYVYDMMLGSFVRSISSHLKTICLGYLASFEFIFKPVNSIFDFLSNKKNTEISEEQKEAKTNREKILKSVILGLVISLPLLLVVLGLLCSADDFFSDMIGDIFSVLPLEKVFEFIFSGNLFGIILMTAAVFLYAGAFVIFHKEKNRLEIVAKVSKHEWDSYIAITFSTVICFVYILFCGTQVYEVIAEKMNTLPGSYASQAREGFFQLLFVCLINVFLVLCTTGWFKKNHVLQVILTAICTCTYFMTASSAYSMIRYVRRYNLTFLRYFVLWALVIIAILMAGIMISIYYREMDLFRYIVVVVTVGFIALSTSHPDYVIAKYNIEKSGQLDLDYLTHNLSTDATPAIVKYADRFENDGEPNDYNSNCYYYRSYIVDLKKEINEIDKHSSVRKFNVSSQIAKNCIKN